MFTLGESPEEENGSSFEANSLQRSSLSQQTDSEDHVAESAIDSDEDDWEDDDNEESGPPKVTEPRPMFPRIYSQPNLSSRHSLLTTALHQGDRASAPQNAASRPSSAIRRSRTTTPTGPSTGNSPHEDSGMMREQASRSKPMIMTTSNVHLPVMPPDTTRRDMLSSELTGSLRQNLLLERQQKNATSDDVKGLNTNEQQAQIRFIPFRDDQKSDDFYNQFFQGGGFHDRGW